MDLIAASQLPIFDWYKRFAKHSRRHRLGCEPYSLVLLGVIFAGVPVVWILSIAQAQPMPMMSFVVFKAFWAAAIAKLAVLKDTATHKGIASIITPIVGWWALARASGKL